MEDSEGSDAAGEAKSPPVELGEDLEESDAEDSIKESDVEDSTKESDVEDSIKESNV